MQDDKLVSIYIATKDRPSLLVRALASVYMQTWKNIEVLVCDDCSSTDLSPIREAFGLLFDKLVWIRNDRSLGPQVCYNKLIALATGEYLTGLDDDDQFTHDRIEKFMCHPNRDKYSFLCARYHKWDSEENRPDSLREGLIQLKDMLDSNIVGNHIFVKKTHVADIGGYDEHAPTKGDFDLFLRLIQQHGDAYRINAITYNIYFDYALRKRMSPERSIKGMKYFLDKHSNILSKKNINNIRVNDYIERKGRLTLTDVVNILKYGNWIYGLRLLRAVIKNKII